MIILTSVVWFFSLIFFSLLLNQITHTQDSKIMMMIGGDGGWWLVCGIGLLEVYAPSSTSLFNWFPINQTSQAREAHKDPQKRLHQEGSGWNRQMPGGNRGERRKKRETPLFNYWLEMRTLNFLFHFCRPLPTTVTFVNFFKSLAYKRFCRATISQLWDVLSVSSLRLTYM